MKVVVTGRPDHITGDDRGRESQAKRKVLGKPGHRAFGSRR